METTKTRVEVPTEVIRKLKHRALTERKTLLVLVREILAAAADEKK